MINKFKNTKGQVALVLILLSAAGLIFYAITLNWGRIAQEKALLTQAADGSAIYLASAAASYGEMEKQMYLQNGNKLENWTGVIIDVFLLVIAIIVLAVPGPWQASGPWLTGLAIASLGMSVVTLVLQLAVINPMTSALWNKLQANLPIQEQFYESGISTALQGSITDQVNITDYFDANANGVFGNNANGFSNDSIGRFAFFYTDRLKMLNQQGIPQIDFFYNQLAELMNGETCAQNESDNKTYGDSVIPLNPACCITSVSNPACQMSVDCVTDPSDPACQLKIPQPYGFQLNDQCPASSDPSTPGYSPYCDPCCQPQSVVNPLYCGNTTTTTTTTNGVTTTTCTGTNSAGQACNCDPLVPQYISLRPSNCPADVTVNGVSAPQECWTNNPYGGASSVYPLLYDPTYQEYSNNLSFLDQFGRDQQWIEPASTLPLTNMTPQGNFPNGIYPFFWLMKEYSPEVAQLDPATTPLTASDPDNLHWCAVGGDTADSSLTGFPDLAQLSLPYTCTGNDCCVNYLANTNPPSTTVNAAVIDNVDNPSFASNAPNPVSNNYFGESIPSPPPPTTTWTPADNQFCSTTWPYNGSSAAYPDGSCEWTNTVTTAPLTSTTPVIPPSTFDSLDDTMHTLSDFVNFANTFLNQDVDALSSSFDTWYPQVAAWIAPEQGTSACAKVDPTRTGVVCNSACDDGSTCTAGKCTDGTACTDVNGRLLNIYNPYTGWDEFHVWTNIITKWLNNDYARTYNAWCVPPSNDPNLNYNGAPTAESTYIADNGKAIDNQDPDATPAWGDLGYVIACLNYNSNQNPVSSQGPVGPPPPPAPVTYGSVYNYQQCLNWLTGPACSTTFTGTPCDPGTLGRTLLAGAKPAPGCKGTPFETWITNSLAVATDEAPKFALRAAFLTDIDTRAQTMQKIFEQGDTALKSFMAPCVSAPPCDDGSTCSTSGQCSDGTSCGACGSGGPAAQLMYARAQGASTVSSLPNSVIYGWRDRLPNGALGSSHIVKVTAYSPGRNGTASKTYYMPSLPWIKTTTGLFTRTYELLNRDGYTYVSVKRWDSDHPQPLTFPNNHTLWQFLFHTPTGKTNTGNLPSQCFSGSGGIGFGLWPGTVTGLELPASGYSGSTLDQQSLGNAFMLNDSGNGQVDPAAKTDPGDYKDCLSAADTLLMNAPESHACAYYVASSTAAGPTPHSCPQDSNPSCSGYQNDYSMRFVDCASIPPEDLGNSNQ